MRREDYLRKLESEYHLLRFAKAQMVLCDRWHRALKATEYRVIEFVLRQTLGWNKTGDIIALDQFINGIDGRCGVGVSRSNVIKAIDAVVEMGLLLELERFYPNSKKRKASSFSVNLDMLFAGPPIVAHSDERGQGSAEPVKIGPVTEQSPVNGLGNETTANGPASDTTTQISTGSQVPTGSDGLASETVVVLPAIPQWSRQRDPQSINPLDVQSNAPPAAPRVNDPPLEPLPSLRTISAELPQGFCPTCNTKAWKPSTVQAGAIVCGLCNCEEAGYPELRAFVTQFRKGRGY